MLKLNLYIIALCLNAKGNSLALIILMIEFCNATSDRNLKSIQRIQLHLANSFMSKNLHLYLIHNVFSVAEHISIILNKAKIHLFCYPAVILNYLFIVIKALKQT